MWKNNLKIAVRNLLRNKFFATLNILGLVIAIASSLLIGLYIRDELSFDRFHRDANQVFRIHTHWGDNPQENIYATTPPPLKAKVEGEIPEVAKVARAFKWNDSTMRLPKEESETEVVFRESKIYIVDTNFLEVLDFNIIAGEAATAFRQHNAIVLTKATAQRYFGTNALQKGEVIGKTILFGGSQMAREVTAVVDPPKQSHFQFDMLVNGRFGYRGIMDNDNWAWNIMHTYVKVKAPVLKAEGGLSNVQKKLTRLAETHARPFMQNSQFGPESSLQVFDYQLMPVKDIHLHAQFLREHQPNGNAKMVYALSMIAFFIILLACINFMNFSTAQAARRAREVGMRKVLGSGRKRLISQFLTESVLITGISGFLALGLVEIFRSGFNTLSGKHLPSGWFEDPTLLMILLPALLITGLIAGIYPAFYLSAYRPSEIIKGQLVHNRGQALGVRNTLVVFQFAISVGLIICTTLVYQQLRFMQTKNLGYDQENVLVIKNDREIQEKWEPFKEALIRQPQTQSASFATHVPFQPIRDMRDFRVEGSTHGQGIHWVLADYDYINTLELEVIDGRGFLKEMGTDSTGLLLNEAAVKALNLSSPVGARIIKNAGAQDEEQLKVIGFIRDYNFESFYNEVKPLAIQYYRPDYLTDYIAVKLKAGDLEAGINQVKSVWKSFEPGNPFLFSFLDQDFDALFRADRRLGKVMGLFTGLGILIACMGLLGLVTFTAEQRTKEIGIRKVLGASVFQITLMLTREFTLLVILSIVVAVPLAYLAMQEWLAAFAFRININPWVFLLAGFMGLIIAWATVSLQAFRAARSNPIEVLRQA